MKPARRVLLSIKLDGRRVGYSVRESRTARKCRIRVNPAGIEVVVPRGSDKSRASGFLRENASWVLNQLAFMERMGTVRVNAPRARLGSLLLGGDEVQTEVIKEPSRRAFALIEREGLVLRIRVPETGEVDVRRALESWLRRRARREIEARIAERARQMKVKPGRLYIMSQRTKWGGCSRLRNLSFTWRLIMAPPGVLDYIVVHELAHLIEPSHSVKFWLIVRSHCPEFEEYRRWLRDNQERLDLPQRVGAALH